MRDKTIFAKLGVPMLLVSVIACVFVATFFSSAFPPWVGFGADPLPSGVPANPIVIYQPEKTLWDWLQLLLVPMVITIGGFLFTRSENRRVQQLETQRAMDMQQLETQRAMDIALQSYLEQMTELLLHENLLRAKEEDPVRAVAQVRTLTIVKQLDGERKLRVMQFLYEAQLIGQHVSFSDVSKNKEAVMLLTELDLSNADAPKINLSGSNFSYVNFESANLTGAYINYAKLTGAKLTGAKLTGAKFMGANLAGANLAGANLAGAILLGTNLTGADLTGANLAGAELVSTDLTGANLAGANLAGANLFHTNLTDVNLTDVNLTDVNLDDAIGISKAKID